MTTIEELNKELENLLDAVDHEVEESVLFRDMDETKKQLPFDVWRLLVISFAVGFVLGYAVAVCIAITLSK